MSEPVVVFRGPDSEAQQVNAILAARGLRADVLRQAGGWEQFSIPGPFDSQVVVPAADAGAAQAVLAEDGRWRLPDEEQEEAGARFGYGIIVIAAVLVVTAGIALLAFILTRP